jgi:hypothetical protein
MTEAIRTADCPERNAGRLLRLLEVIRLTAIASFLRPLLPYLVGVAAFSWGIILIAWLLLPQARTVELVIPNGAAARIALGEVVDTLPTNLLLRRGDTLLLINQDVQPHRIGSVWVDPDMSSRTLVTTEFQNSGSVITSFHPGGSIGVSPQSHPGLESTIIPTLFLFFTLSLVTVATLTVVRRLDTA